MASLFRGLEVFARLEATKRFMSSSTKAAKRFYKHVNVVRAGEGAYEVTLDSRKLKTPSGAAFTVRSEALALAVAHEWSVQKDLIRPSQMHLTGLCNTCEDNPTRLSKFDAVSGVLGLLETDTILFFSEEPEGLAKLQQDRWQPLVDWFCTNLHGGISIEPSRGSVSAAPNFSEGSLQRVRRHLLSHSFEAVQGFCFGADALKSLILMSAVAENRLTVDQAVALSRLEVEFQTGVWGNVEWAHDLELHDTTSRLAAASLFYKCHSTSSQRSVKRKGS